jgi:N-acetylglucosamine-6-phosphate deacetylase
MAAKTIMGYGAAVAETEPFALKGRLLLPSGLEAGALVIEGGRIREVLRTGPAGGLPTRVREAPIVAPGLVDLQVNGGFGVEVGADPAAIRHLAAKLPSTGVTAWLPTVVSSPPSFYPSVYEAFDAARHSPGAQPLGLHLEGPYLSPERAGAHRRGVIEQAPDDLMCELLDGDALRLMTLAPERPGALERIRRLCERGVVASLGHTNATYETFKSGIDAGATMATHLYNAMSPLGHRAPGAIGAALLDPRITCGIIADGVHCHAATLELARRLKGVERMVLVTDAIAAAGMAPGRYQLDGQPVISDGVSARLEDGTLAGSVLTLDQAVRNLVQLAWASTAEALRMASETPAHLIGLTRKGRLEVGYDADVVLLDEALQVQATYVGGQVVFERATSPKS